jgi:hypothetical protein
MYREGMSLHYEPDHTKTADPPPSPDESLVSDSRDGLTPAEQVERKLVSLLKSTPMPVSRLQSAVSKRSLS